MDVRNFSSEIGQKMRSAVKAKLLELGSGSASGYIDDELPDYVMIMVANKRSKQQMAADLDLFLGSKTELFVTWLHEVLQKLQEVTLPVTSAAAKVRKGEDAASKKDKKSAKKDKEKKSHSGAKDVHEKPTTSTDKEPPVVSSINDVFAEEILEKAQTSQEISTTLKEEIKKKKQKQNEPAAAGIAEISSTTGGTTAGAAAVDVNRVKDLEELAKLQQKIDAAKKFLRKTGELADETDSGSDGDYLNLRADDDDEESGTEEVVQEKAVLDLQDHESEHVTHTPPPVESRHDDIPKSNHAVEPKPIPEGPQMLDQYAHRRAQTPEIENAQACAIDPMPMKTDHTHNPFRDRDQTCTPPPPPRRPVHERLGRPARISPEIPRQRPANGKSASSSSRGVIRRLGPPKSPDRGRSRGRSRSRHRETSPVTSNRQRIGSRVIVPVNRAQSIHSEAESISEERPVNSVIKVKPRPPVSPRRQAPKNLLMRAMADAQRSTLLAKASSQRKRTLAPNRSSSPPIAKRLRQVESPSKYPVQANGELFRRTTKGIIVRQVNVGQQRSSFTEEYGPLGVCTLTTGESINVCLPQSNNRKVAVAILPVSRDETEVTVSTHEPKFVVTLDDEALCEKYEHTLKGSPLPQVSSSSTNARKKKTFRNKRQRRALKQKLTNSEEANDDYSPVRGSTPSPRRKPAIGQKRNVAGDILRHAVDFNRSIIVNPEVDEDDDISSRRKSIKLHAEQLVIAEDVDGSMTPPLPQRNTKSVRSQSRTRSPVANAKSCEPPRLPPGRAVSEENIRSRKHSSPNNPSGVVKEMKAKAITPAKEILPKQQQSSRSRSVERKNGEQEIKPQECRKISIRNVGESKYDNIPALSSVLKPKPKPTCAFAPNCTKQFCEFYHPTAPCKAFPNCKFADKCMYQHPRCKFDTGCVSPDCNFSHSGPRKLPLIAPPLSSHVIPVQNYKSISTAASNPATAATCKFYPNCTNPTCSFAHPKQCRYGKFCTRQLDCSFYHPELQSSSKFKWIASG